MSIAPAANRADRAPAATATKRRRASDRPAPAQRVTVKPIRALVPVALGALWAVALVGALAISSLLSVAVLAPIAVLGTITGIRATEGKRRRRAPTRALSPLLMAGMTACVVDPLIALGGPLPGVSVLLLTGAALVSLAVVSGYAASARPLRWIALRFVAAFVPTLVVTSVILARHQGSNLALAMVGATLAYDAGAFLMGNGRTALGGAVAVISGMVSVGVVGIFAAAIMNPPFAGSRPAVVFAGVAGLAPLGVRLCQWPASGERLPALRRLDSLAVVAPAWVVMAGLLLHR